MQQLPHALRRQPPHVRQYTRIRIRIPRRNANCFHWENLHQRRFQRGQALRLPGEAAGTFQPAGRIRRRIHPGFVQRNQASVAELFHVRAHFPLRQIQAERQLPPPNRG